MVRDVGEAVGGVREMLEREAGDGGMFLGGMGSQGS